MTIIRHEVKGPHSKISNAVIRDARLHLEDIGLFGTIIAISEGKDSVTINELKSYSLESDHKIIPDCLRRLEECGYLKQDGDVIKNFQQANK